MASKSLSVRFFWRPAKWRRLLPVGLAALLVGPWTAGCGGRSLQSVTDAGSDAGSIGGSDAGFCTAIAPPPGAVLPHVNATGANAAAIAQALDAIFAAQTPPLSPGQTYEIPSLGCADISEANPAAPSGYECTFQLHLDGGPETISVGPPSVLAQNLFDALSTSGSTMCTDDPAGPYEALENVNVTASAIQFDDVSNYDAPSTPNIVVRGSDAESVIDAVAAAGIDDCDPTRKLLLVCNAGSGAPSCGTAWMLLQKVGSSELIPDCGPSSAPMATGTTLAAAPSFALWQSIMTAARGVGFQPSSGTLAQATIMNASFFDWDGSNLGFTLVTGDATPPPP